MLRTLHPQPGGSQAYPPGASTCCSPSTVSSSSPSSRNRTASARGSGSGRVLPPPAPTSMRYWLKVSANPDSGRARTHSRVFSQCGSELATMSVSEPFGITT